MKLIAARKRKTQMPQRFMRLCTLLSSVVILECSFASFAQAANSESDGSAGFFLLILFVAVIYFIPAVIAFRREHEYRWVIFALNFVGGFTGILWIVALVWAVFPDNRSAIDPFVGPVTGRGVRNAGDAIGEATFGKERGYLREQSKQPQQFALAGLETQLKTLEHLHKLMEMGVLTKDEFESKKQQILGSLKE